MTRRRFYPALLLVMAAIVVLGRWAERLILWPSTEPMDARGLERIDLSLQGKRVVVFAARRPQPDVYVLRLYGNADRAEPNVIDDARHLMRVTDLEVEVWGLDYPGYGPSQGPAKLLGVADSAQLAFDTMRAQARGRRCYVVATSLGTTGALHVSATRAVDGLVIQNPPPLRELIRGRYGWPLWPVAAPISLQVPSELDSIDNARHSNAPAIFVLAGLDQVVPPPYARRVYEAYAGPKLAIERPRDEHNDPLDLYRESSDREAARRLLHR